jgi:hypothetical protein
MEEEQNQAEQKKISLPEAIIMIEIVGSADLVKLFVSLTGIGIIIAAIINFIVGGIMLLWLFMKGARGLGKLISMFIPIQTLALLVVIYLVNHPKIIKTTEKLTGGAAKIAEKAIK